MQKEEIINEIMNTKLHIAQLKLREKELLEELDAAYATLHGKTVAPVNSKERFVVLPPVAKVPHGGVWTEERRRKFSAICRKRWASLTSEQRAELGQKIAKSRLAKRQAA